MALNTQTRRLTRPCRRAASRDRASERERERESERERERERDRERDEAHTDTENRFLFGLLELSVIEIDCGERHSCQRLLYLRGATELYAFVVCRERRRSRDAGVYNGDLQVRAVLDSRAVMCT